MYIIAFSIWEDWNKFILAFVLNIDLIIKNQRYDYLTI